MIVQAPPSLIRRKLPDARRTLAAFALVSVVAACSRQIVPPKPAAAPADTPANVSFDAGKSATRSEVARVQSQVMDFTDDFIQRLGDVVDRIEATEPPMKGRKLAHKLRMRTAQGAVAIAAGQNPYVSLADMVVMIGLQRRLLQSAFNPTDFEFEWDALVEVFRHGEAQIREVAAKTFTPEQLAEIDQLIDRWLTNNPDRRFATSVRLDDFAAARQATMLEPADNHTQSVFSLLRIDPLANLNPTNREIEQSRLLAERAFFYLQRAPQLVSWQAESLMLDSLSQREVQSLVENADRITAAAQQFTSQTGEVTEEIPRLIEQQRAAAIDQAADRLSLERQAAIDQAFDRLAQERKDFIAELDSRQAELSSTLSELRTTIQAADSLVAGSNQLVDASEQLATRLGFDPEAPETEGASIDDYRQLLSQADNVVGSTREVVESVDRLAQSPAWNDRVANLQTVTNDFEQRVDRLIRHAFWYALIVVGVSLVGALAVGALLRLIPIRTRIAQSSS